MFYWLVLNLYVGEFDSLYVGEFDSMQSNEFITELNQFNFNLNLYIFTCSVFLSHKVGFLH